MVVNHMAKNIIITCSNEKNSSFLIDHWYKSLKKNVNLNNIDVMVIDYGLSEKSRQRLRKEKVILSKGNDRYHIVNGRFFDAGSYLKKNKYDQVLFVDGGDVIFQEDFSGMFDKDKDTFRVVPLSMEVLFFEWFLFNNFSEKIKQKIWKVIRNKPVINAGVIFAPAGKFIKLASEMSKLIKNKRAFGPDQIVLNYFLYKSEYKFMDRKYNFMVSTEDFKVVDGIFYTKNGNKVSIVHNAGQVDFFRAIDNFGYGKKNNKLKHVIYHAKRAQYNILGAYKKIFS